jgi:hypothetical protein
MKIVKSNKIDFNYMVNGTETVSVNSKGTVVSDEVAAQIVKVFPFVEVEDASVGVKNPEVVEVEVKLEEEKVEEEVISDEEVVSEPEVVEESEDVAEDKPKRGRGKNK